METFVDLVKALALGAIIGTVLGIFTSSCLIGISEIAIAKSIKYVKKIIEVQKLQPENKFMLDYYKVLALVYFYIAEFSVAVLKFSNWK